MHFAPIPYLDPGSGSVLIQLIVGFCVLCGTPAAAVAAVIAFLRQRAKKPKDDTISTKES